MNIPRVLIADSLEIDSEVQLSPESSKHLSKVLRKERKNKIEVFDGIGNSCEAEIIDPLAKSVMVRIVSNKVHQTKPKKKINLALSLIKPSNFDYAIQKCTELGVDKIVPILAERSIYKIDQKTILNKKKRWHMIAQGACEQCGNNWLPQITNVMRITEWIKSLTSSQKIVFTLSASNKLSEVSLKEEIDILIGPEGDLSINEVEELVKNGFSSLSLGQRILRAETAAIASVSSIRALSGEF